MKKCSGSTQLKNHNNEKPCGHPYKTQNYTPPEVADLSQAMTKIQYLNIHKLTKTVAKKQSLNKNPSKIKPASARSCNTKMVNGLCYAVIKNGHKCEKIAQANKIRKQINKKLTVQKTNGGMKINSAYK